MFGYVLLERDFATLSEFVGIPGRLCSMRFWLSKNSAVPLRELVASEEAAHDEY